VLKKTVEATILQSILEFIEQLKRGGEILLHIHGLTSQQWIILLHIAMDPNLPFFKGSGRDAPPTASELASYFNVSRANITNLLNTLSEKGLVRQVDDTVDKRRKILRLTEKGEAMVDRLEVLRHEANDKLFESFSAFEKSLFLNLIDRCLVYQEEENKRLRGDH
jgi:DNA-binding MarR family transcriptional regulator